MADTQHTPTALPWHAVHTAIMAGDMIISDTHSRFGGPMVDLANAAHIVKCVNAHAALVELAQEIVKAIEEDDSLANTSPISDDVQWFADKARAALALAKAAP